MAPPPIIAKARARLLVRAPFFGSIALGLAWVDAPQVDTMATDGRSIWFNAAWCEAQGVVKTMGVIAHEVLHVVNKHHLRRRERDPERWNIAADLMINRVLEEDGYELPADGLFDRQRRFAGLPVETIYERLEGDAESAAPVPSADAGAGDRADGHGPRGGDTDTPEPPDGGNPAGGPAPARHWGEIRDLAHEDGSALTPSERRQADADLNVRIRQAAAAAKRAGKLAGSLVELIEAVTSTVDWQDRFRCVFDGLLRGEPSWTRPNRRFIPLGLVMPGWRRTGIGRVAFVLDTSGSIGSRELAAYAGAVRGLIEETAPSQLLLIQCDTAVRHVQELHPGENLDRIEVRGRGGTLFQPAFDWLAASGFEPKAILYATDLYSADTPTDPGVPVIWLTPTRGRAVPFGEIVEVTL